MRYSITWQWILTLHSGQRSAPSSVGRASLRRCGCAGGMRIGGTEGTLARATPPGTPPGRLQSGESRQRTIERYVDNDRTIAMIKRVVSQGSNDSSDENDFWWCISVLKIFLNDRKREIPEILSSVIKAIFKAHRNFSGLFVKSMKDPCIKME